jgi:hypothetical protein
VKNGGKNLNLKFTEIKFFELNTFICQIKKLAQVSTKNVSVAIGIVLLEPWDNFSILNKFFILEVFYFSGVISPLNMMWLFVNNFGCI